MGWVAASAGNHALGVAFAAAALGGPIRVTLFVPTTAPRTKLEKLRTFPVEVRQVGNTYDDAHGAAQAFAKRTGVMLADSVEDMLLAAGHGRGLRVGEARDHHERGAVGP